MGSLAAGAPRAAAAGLACAPCAPPMPRGSKQSAPSACATCACAIQNKTKQSGLARSQSMVRNRLVGGTARVFSVRHLNARPNVADSKGDTFAPVAVCREVRRVVLNRTSVPIVCEHRQTQLRSVVYLHVHIIRKARRERWAVPHVAEGPVEACVSPHLHRLNHIHFALVYEDLAKVLQRANEDTRETINQSISLRLLRLSEAARDVRGASSPRTDFGNGRSKPCPVQPSGGSRRRLSPRAPPLPFR